MVWWFPVAGCDFVDRIVALEFTILSSPDVLAIYIYESTRLSKDSLLVTNAMGNAPRSLHIFTSQHHPYESVKSVTVDYDAPRWIHFCSPLVVVELSSPLFRPESIGASCNDITCIPSLHN